MARTVIPTADLKKKIKEAYTDRMEVAARPVRY